MEKNNNKNYYISKYNNIVDNYENIRIGYLGDFLDMIYIASEIKPKSVSIFTYVKKEDTFTDFNSESIKIMIGKCGDSDIVEIDNLIMKNGKVHDKGKTIEDTIIFHPNKKNKKSKNNLKLYKILLYKNDKDIHNRNIESESYFLPLYLFPYNNINMCIEMEDNGKLDTFPLNKENIYAKKKLSSIKVITEYEDYSEKKPYRNAEMTTIVDNQRKKIKIINGKIIDISDINIVNTTQGYDYCNIM